MLQDGLKMLQDLAKVGQNWCQDGAKISVLPRDQGFRVKVFLNLSLAVLSSLLHLPRGST